MIETLKIDSLEEWETGSKSGNEPQPRPYSGPPDSGDNQLPPRNSYRSDQGANYGDMVMDSDPSKLNAGPPSMSNTRKYLQFSAQFPKIAAERFQISPVTYSC